MAFRRSWLALMLSWVAWGLNFVLEFRGACQAVNKFDPNKDASNIIENERIFLNLLEFT